MNAQIKERWLTALRSGNYSQGKNLLRDEQNDYCCLGVLCDVVKADYGLDWVPDPVNGRLGFDGNYMELPDSILEGVGLDRGTTRHLVNLNDGVGLNFEQIADFIENNL
jgi:hypothetical protein